MPTFPSGISNARQTKAPRNAVSTQPDGPAAAQNRQRALEHFLQRCKTAGDPLNDWMEAERALKAQLRSSGRTVRQNAVDTQKLGGETVT